MDRFMHWLLPKWDDAWMSFKSDGTMDWPAFYDFFCFKSQFDKRLTRRVFDLFDAGGTGKVTTRQLLCRRRKYEYALSNDLGSEGLGGLTKMLRGKYGSETRAWRLLFDPDNTDHCSYETFCRICKQLGLSGDIIATWRHATQEQSLRHHGLAPDADEVLTEMAKAMVTRWGSLSEGWHVMMRSGRIPNRLHIDEFDRFMHSLGFTVRQTKTLFACLASLTLTTIISNSGLEFFAQFEVGHTKKKYNSSKQPTMDSHADIVAETDFFKFAKICLGQDPDDDNSSDEEEGRGMTAYSVVMSEKERERYEDKCADKRAAASRKGKIQAIQPMHRGAIRQLFRDSLKVAPGANPSLRVDKLDVNNDRELSLGEFQKGVRDVLLLNSADLPDAQLHALFNLLGPNADGRVSIENLLAWIEGSKVATRGYRRIFRPQTASLRETCKMLQLSHAQEQEYAKEFGPHERNSKVVEFKQSWIAQGEKGQVQARPVESNMQTRSRLLKAIFAEVDVESSQCLRSALAKGVSDKCAAHVKQALAPKAAVPLVKKESKKNSEEDKEFKSVSRATVLQPGVAASTWLDAVLDDWELEEEEDASNLSTVDVQQFEELLAPSFDQLFATAAAHKDVQDSTIDIIFRDVRSIREKIWQRLSADNMKKLAEEANHFNDEPLLKLHKIQSRQAEDGRPDDWHEAITQLQADDIYVPPVVHHSKHGAISDMLRMVAVTRW
jgi:Ca2+-binding EF-hand superfamily protein